MGRRTRLGSTTAAMAGASYWIMFAGVLLLTLGAINGIDGIAAIGKAHFYVANAHYVFGELNIWGRVVLCLGALQVLVGLGVFARNQFARGPASASCP